MLFTCFLQDVIQPISIYFIVHFIRRQRNIQLLLIQFIIIIFMASFNPCVNHISLVLYFNFTFWKTFVTKQKHFWVKPSKCSLSIRGPSQCKDTVLAAYHRLIFIMEISIPGNTVFILRRGPDSWYISFQSRLARSALKASLFFCDIFLLYTWINPSFTQSH